MYEFGIKIHETAFKRKKTKKNFANAFVMKFTFDRIENDSVTINEARNKFHWMVVADWRLHFHLCVCGGDFLSHESDIVAFIAPSI